MIISERVFKILKERKISQVEFARRAGLSNSTVSDWKRKKTNPSAEKIMDICYVLEVTPEQLLTGSGIDDADPDNPIPAAPAGERHLDKGDLKLLEDVHGLKDAQRKRLLAYVEALKKIEELEDLGSTGQ